MAVVALLALLLSRTRQSWKTLPLSSPCPRQRLRCVVVPLPKLALLGGSIYIMERERERKEVCTRKREEAEERRDEVSVLKREEAEGRERMQCQRGRRTGRERMQCQPPAPRSYPILLRRVTCFRFPPGDSSVRPYGLLVLGACGGTRHGVSNKNRTAP